MTEQQPKPITVEEQKILALIHQFKSSSSVEANKKKTLTALKNSRKFLDEAIKLLEGSEKTDATDKAGDSDAPYGRKQDGTPKKPPGRTAAVKPGTEA